MVFKASHPCIMHEHGQPATSAEAGLPVAVVATLTEGYDIDYIWKQVYRGPAKDAASYYI